MTRKVFLLMSAIRDAHPELNQTGKERLRRSILTVLQVRSVAIKPQAAVAVAKQAQLFASQQLQNSAKTTVIFM